MYSVKIYLFIVNAVGTYFFHIAHFPIATNLRYKRLQKLLLTTCNYVRLVSTAK